MKHAFDSGLKENSIAHARKTILAFNETCKKPVTAISLLDGEVRHFDSIRSASEILGIKDVGKPLRKITLTANGYCFEYGILNAEEAEKAKQAVESALGERKIRALKKRLATKRGDANATNY